MELRKQAEWVDIEADALFKHGMREDGEMKRKDALRLRNKAGRIENINLPKLKEALSALRTGTLPGISAPEVVLQ